MFLFCRAFSVFNPLPAVLATVVALLLCTTTANGSKQVVEATASLPMVGEWVRAVGKEQVSVRVIAPDGADPHTFEPSVRSIQAVNRAQVLFVIGLGLEPWAERLMKADSTLNIVAIAPVNGLKSIGAHGASSTEAHAHSHTHTEACATHHDHSHPHGHAHTADCSEHGHKHVAGHDHNTTAHAGHDASCAHGEFDPHVWLDPVLVKDMVRIIEHTLSELSPQHAATFKSNADAYCALLDTLDTEIRVILTPIDLSRRKLVTNHDNLRYFADRYDFIVLDTLFSAQGTAGGQPSARRVREIVARIHENDVTAIFADASSSRNLLDAVAREANIGAAGDFYSIPAGAASPAPDYISMMRHNAHEIARALAPGANH